VTIPVPQLDDRRFDDLVEEATTYLRGKTDAWTDFSPGDPGVVLVELFAYLTDLMIYRLTADFRGIASVVDQGNLPAASVGPMLEVVVDGLLV